MGGSAIVELSNPLRHIVATSENLIFEPRFSLGASDAPSRRHYLLRMI
jgi:hypothetical protein